MTDFADKTLMPGRLIKFWWRSPVDYSAVVLKVNEDSSLDVQVFASVLWPQFVEPVVNVTQVKTPITKEEIKNAEGHWSW